MLWRRTPVRSRTSAHAGRQASRSLASASDGASGDPWKSFLDWFMESSTAPHHRHQARRRCASSGRHFPNGSTKHLVEIEPGGRLPTSQPRRPSRFPKCPCELDPQQFSRVPKIADCSDNVYSCPVAGDGEPPSRSSRHAGGSRLSKGRGGRGPLPTHTDLLHRLQHTHLLHQPSVGRSFHFTANANSSIGPAEQLESVLENGMDQDVARIRSQREARRAALPDEFAPGSISDLASLLNHYILELDAINSFSPDLNHLGSRIWKVFRKVAEDSPADLKTLDRHEFKILTEIAKRSKSPPKERVDRVNLVLEKMADCEISPRLWCYEALMAAHIGENDATHRCTEIIDDAISTGMYPRLQTYNILFRAHITEHGLESGKKWLFEEAEGKVQIRSGPASELVPFAPDRITYNIILHSHVKQGDISAAAACMEEMEKIGLNPNEFSWTILMYGYSKIGDRAAVMRSFRTMVAKGLRPTRVTYETMIFALLGGGRPTRDFIRETETGQKEGTRIVESIVEEGTMAEAMEVYEEMLSAGFKPGVTLYNIFMTSYLNRKEPTRVRSLFNDMISTGVHPDAVSYSVAMSACVQAEDVPAIDELFQHMRDHEVEPDVGLYGNVMAAHGRLGDLKKVRWYLEQMVQDGWRPTYHIWHILLNAYCKARDLEGAHRVIEEMQRNGFPATEITYNTLMHGYGIAGDVEGVERILHSIQKKRITVSVETFNTAIAAYARNQDRERAMQLYTKMVDRGYVPDRVTFNILINLEATRLDSVGAGERYRAMLSAGLEPDARTYVPLITLHANRSDMERARAIQRHMLSLPHITRSIIPHNTMIQAMSKHGNVSGAIEEYEFATNVQKERPDIQTFDMLVRAHAYRGDIEGARKWFNMTIERGIQPDIRLWNALMSAYVVAQDRDGAFEVWKEMSKAGLTGDIFTYTLMLKVGVNRAAANESETDPTAAQSKSRQSKHPRRVSITAPTERRHTRMRAWSKVGLEANGMKGTNVANDAGSERRLDGKSQDTQPSDAPRETKDDTPLHTEHTENNVVTDAELVALAAEEGENLPTYQEEQAPGGRAATVGGI